MPRRFREHLRNHPYILAMLERGLFPLPVILCEFTTWCDVHSREVERDIMLQLREQGHSAFGDDTQSGWKMHGEEGKRMLIGDYDLYAIAEEQAHQTEFLKELWRNP